MSIKKKLGLLRRFLTVAAVGCIIFFYILTTHSPNVPTHLPHVPSYSADMRFFAPVLLFPVNALTLKDRSSKKAKQVFANSKDLLSKSYLESCLNVPEETFKELADSHRKYVNFLKSEANSVDAFAFVEKKSRNWKHYKDRNGIVMVGGGKYSWLSFLSILQLRKTGSSMPVELFIASSEEYEAEFCEVVMPKYNARCMVFENPAPLERLFKVNGYQYKILALLTSSFENILYLDSDVFPLHSIDFMFESKIYKDSGLVLWPDAWARTTSPKFYEVAGIDVPENKIRYSLYEVKAQENGESIPPLKKGTFDNSNFHDFENTISNPTVEAGALLVNKTAHVHTLQLALYYNILGPHYYYPLITQGGAGEGDKDTFIAAAHVLNKPYHLNLKSFSWVGYHHKETGEYVSKALGMTDPVLAHTHPDQDKTLLLHCSYPKYLPDLIINEIRYLKSGDHLRMYEQTYENAGYDVDLRLFDLFAQGFCEDYTPENPLRSHRNDLWASNFSGYIREALRELNEACEQVFLPHLDFLRKTTKYPNTNK